MQGLPVEDPPPSTKITSNLMQREKVWTSGIVFNFQILHHLITVLLIIKVTSSFKLQGSLPVKLGKVTGTATTKELMMDCLRSLKRNHKVTIVQSGNRIFHFFFTLSKWKEQEIKVKL